MSWNLKKKKNFSFQPMIRKIYGFGILHKWNMRFPVNGENIIFLVNYILFTYAFPKLLFNVSLSAAIGVHVSKKVCNFISTKIWNLKLSNLKPTKHPTWENFEIWGNSLCHFLLFFPNPISGNSHFHSSFNTQR